MSSGETMPVTMPSRASKRGWCFVAFVLLTLPFVCFVSPGLRWYVVAPAFFAAGALLGRELPEWRGHALLWSGFGLGLMLHVPWPLSLILPVAMVPALRRALPSLRPIAQNLRWGTLDRGTCFLAGSIVVVSSAALVAWFIWGGADVSDMIAAVPRAPFGFLLAGSLVFSVANALWEELLMKWLVWDALERLHLRSAAVIIVQAALFGLLHFHGFPRGWLGVALAAGYGVLLGALRLRSGGLLALVVTHVFADIVICLLILSRVPIER
jgi:membrane protease YdiL (CAAX protease family)